MYIQKNSSQMLKYIILQENRVFIDICERGCGSGCLYCYAPYHDEPQKLLSINEIIMLCDYVKEICKDKKMIISLCPNTEPLKSKESIDLVLYIISFFSSLDYYIQISTKEVVPVYFLEQVNKMCGLKLYINISIPYIENSERIEPKAALIEKRFENFNIIKNYTNINSCLYIKPFNANTRQQNLYKYYIDLYNIKTVCIGPKFENGSYLPCTSLYNKTQAKKLYNVQSRSISEFMKMLRDNTEVKVYSSSICSIYNDYYNDCTLKLSQYDEEFCKDCVLRGKTRCLR